MQVVSLKSYFGGKRRRLICTWKLTVMVLVLCQIPQRTLQCSSSKTASKREQADSSLQDSSNESSKENSSTQDQGAKPFQLCSNMLKFELEKICGGQFHDPVIYNTQLQRKKRSLSKSSSSSSSGAPRRVPRSLIDECCRNPCSERNVLKYCRHRPDPGGASTENENGANTTEATPTTTNDSHASENITTTTKPNPLPPGAITSTLPHIMIPLGPQTSDNDFIAGFNQAQI